MKSISVSFVVQYEGELSQAETEPVLGIYLDSHVDNEILEIPVPENESQRKFSVTLNGQYSGELPRDTKIVFYATSVRKNEYDAPCRIDAGFGAMSLLKLVESAQDFQKDIPLLLYTCKRYEKGMIRVTRTPTLINKTSPVRAETVSSPVIDWEPISRHISSSSKGKKKNKQPHPVEIKGLQYIKAKMAKEGTFRETDPETGNIRVPIYYGDVGMFRDIPLPAAAFMLFNAPRSNLAFWENLAKICLERDGLNINDVSMMDEIHQARHMAEMCAALVQALDYIGDVVDKNVKYPKTRRVLSFFGGDLNVAYDPRKVTGCERFGDALRDKCGDCEDLALAIMMVFTALLLAYRAGMFQGSSGPLRAHLLQLGEFAEDYIPLLTLCSVTAAAAEVNMKRGKRKLGAHMCIIFFPTPYFQECVERAPADGDTPKIPFRKPGPKAHKLPILVGEGTGMFECYGIEDDPISGERMCVYKNMDSLRPFKKPIVHKPMSISSFYRSMQEGFTNYWFMDNIPIGGFWLGYYGQGTDPEVGPPDIFQRGVLFTDMVKKSPKMVAYPHPSFDMDLFAWMKEATRIRVKPRDLILTDEGMAKHPGHNEFLDRLARHVNAKGRPETVSQPPAPVFVRDYQLNEAILKELMQDVDRLAPINRMEYCKESLTDWAYCYRVGFHANAK